MDALNKLRALAAAPPQLTSGSKPGDSFVLLRRCLRESGYGPGVWTTWEDSRLNAPSANLTEILIGYQKSHGLDPDGVCGRETWARLAGYDPKHWGTAAAINVGADEQGLRAAFVAKAASYNGLRELPGVKRNRGPQIDAFITHCGINPAGNGNAGVAWCGCFLRYCLDESCKKLGLAVPFNISPSVPIIVGMAKKQQRIIPALQARAGDLWIWKDGDHFRHVEVCRGAVNDGKVLTVGGNTGDGSIYAGDGCYLRKRPAGENLFVNVCRT